MAERVRVNRVEEDGLFMVDLAVEEVPAKDCGIYFSYREAVILREEFKSHHFRRDDEIGGQAYMIMQTIFDLGYEK